MHSAASIAFNTLMPALEPVERMLRAPFDVKQAFKEFETISAERRLLEGDWKDAFRFAMPMRDTLSGGPGAVTPGEDLGKRYADSRVIRATTRGSGNMINAFFPPGRRSAEIEAGPELEAAGFDIEEINAALEPRTKKLFAAIAQSNAHEEATSMALDMMLSMGAMTIDKGTRENPFIIHARPLSEVFPIEGPTGRIETVYRSYFKRIDHVRRIWPTARLSSQQMRMLLQNPDQQVELLECSVGIPGEGNRLVILDKNTRKIILDVQGRDRHEPFRWITPRIFRRPGDNFGRGPLMDQLPSIRRLNKQEEIELRARLQALHPAIMADARMITDPNNIRMGPNGVTLVNGDPRAAVALQQLANIDPVGFQLTDRMLNDIQDGLFANRFLPSVQDSGTMTAQEVFQRKQQHLLDRNVDYGRIKAEFMSAMLRRMDWILGDLGLVEPIKLDGKRFKLRYRGPLDQAQDIEDSNEMLQAVGDTIQVLGPKITGLKVKLEDIPPEILRLRGINSKLLRSEEESDQLQADAAQIAINNPDAGNALTQ